MTATFSKHGNTNHLEIDYKPEMNNCSLCRARIKWPQSVRKKKKKEHEICAASTFHTKLLPTVDSVERSVCKVTQKTATAERSSCMEKTTVSHRFELPKHKKKSWNEPHGSTKACWGMMSRTSVLTVITDTPADVLLLLGPELKCFLSFPATRSWWSFSDTPSTPSPWNIQRIHELHHRIKADPDYQFSPNTHIDPRVIEHLCSGVPLIHWSLQHPHDESLKHFQH